MKKRYRLTGHFWKVFWVEGLYPGLFFGWAYTGIFIHDTFYELEEVTQ